MMEEKVLAAIRRHGLFVQGDNVIVALSGGADSVALFHFLLSHREKLGIGLAAAHFEHGIRGEESLRDCAFVQKLCEEANIELHVAHGRMSECARPKGLGVEAFARRLRYEFLDELAGRCGAKIATAHTQSDNAETVLFHVLRGAGPRGLSGIPWRRGACVRPLLEVCRAEVLAYCAAKGLQHVEDSSNASPAYTRNRLRHEALPLLEDIRPGGAAALARMAGDMAALDEWLGAQARQLLEKAKCDDVKMGLPAWVEAYEAEALLTAPAPLRLKALALLAGRSADRRALARCEAVLAGEMAATVLPGKAEVSRYRGWLLVQRRPPEPGPKETEIPLAEGEFTLMGGYVLCLRVQEGKTGEEVYKKGLTFSADYDKVLKYGVLRARRAQDSFAPAGRGVRKTLKKWMNEAGVPPAARAYLPLLAAGSEVLWLWGHGFAQGLAPGANTLRRLVISCKTLREGMEWDGP